uniref:Uncharacterized protein n=1 Tax=Amphimedon queenslandica TaxID=400682 RepID=A0A1X7TX74_AMPQE
MKTTGVSLNECLHVGPKFNQRITNILLRFRLNKCAFIADREKTFLMIAVAEQDRGILRYLWIDDMDKSSPIIQMLHFAQVMFSIACIPFW